eukprot:scaffold32088_cov62-Phaeocystis_antarctica.AAC.1
MGVGGGVHYHVVVVDQVAHRQDVLAASVGHARDAVDPQPLRAARDEALPVRSLVYDEARVDVGPGEAQVQQPHVPSHRVRPALERRYGRALR